MADTKRTLTALQTLLATNTTGDISAQDVRDFLVSVYGSWTTATRSYTGSAVTNTLDDVVITFDTTGGNIVYNPVGDEGKILLVIKIDSSVNTIAITPTGGDTINGGSSQMIADQHLAVFMIKDGTDWKIISPSLWLTKGSGVGSLFIGSGVSAVGSYNVVIGEEAGANLDTSSNVNVIIGHQAGRDINDGYGNSTSNIFVGAGAGKRRQHSDADTAVSANALSDPTSGGIPTGETGNCAFGYRALDKVTTGQYNIGIGYRAGSFGNINLGIDTGSNNIFIGHRAGSTSTSTSCSIAIGEEATALSNSIAIGCLSTINTTPYTVLFGSAASPIQAISMDGYGDSLVSMRSKSTVLTLTGVTTSTAADFLPAAAWIVGVVARVNTTLPSSTTWELGVSGTLDKFAQAGQSGTAGQTTNSFVSGTGNPGGPSIAQAPFLQATADAAIVTASGAGAAGGVIRITVFYFDMTPPTS